jgi:thiamine-phosphate pyrophosphorylase
MADAKPSCRLYLQVPAPLTAKLEAQLTQALANTSAACVLLCNNDRQMDETLDRLLDLVQTAGIACLIEDDVARAERLGADGVHIPADAELYRHARASLGESANIGVGCGLDRHAAMSLAEMGADYVAFGPEAAGNIDAIDQCAELIAWWSEIFVVPSVAWNIDDVERAARLASLGADFLAPSRAIWQDDNAAALIAGIDDAIRRARWAA